MILHVPFLSGTYVPWLLVLPSTFSAKKGGWAIPAWDYSHLLFCLPFPSLKNIVIMWEWPPHQKVINTIVSAKLLLPWKKTYSWVLGFSVQVSLDGCGTSITPATFSVWAPGDKGDIEARCELVSRVRRLPWFVAAQGCRAGGMQEAVRYFWKACHTLLRALLREVKNGVERPGSCSNRILEYSASAVDHATSQLKTRHPWSFFRDSNDNESQG